MMLLATIVSSLILGLSVATTDSTLEMEFSLASENALKGANMQITCVEDGMVLWKGKIDKYLYHPSDSVAILYIEGLQAKLWSTTSPILYNIDIKGRHSSVHTRTGFRKVESKDGQIWINNHPVFLRGNAVNPPMRGIPSDLEVSREFARDYVRFLKSMNVNIIRTKGNENWLDVCDEEGMMVFGGCYGLPVGSTRQKPKEDRDAAYREYRGRHLEEFCKHPSVVIYTLSNEMAFSGESGALYTDFLKDMKLRLEKWDNTRLYIGNAGYGCGKAGDLYDLHRYWGWYYGSFLTYLNLRDEQFYSNPGKKQPVTFSECVGTYTNGDGSFNICSKTKQPGSQLCWSGHLPEKEQMSFGLEYHRFLTGNAIEMFRRLRSRNPRLSGIMPFTVLFENWDGISSFAEMKPKPAAIQYATSFSPVLLSWENWNTCLHPMSSMDVVAHIVNDAEDFSRLEGSRLEWELRSEDRCLVSGSAIIPSTDYYKCCSIPVSVKLPAAEGYFTLDGKIISKDGTTLCCNSTPIRTKKSPSRPRITATIGLIDSSGKTARVLENMGMEKIKMIEGCIPQDCRAVIIGEDCTSAISSMSGQLKEFCNAGGRILVLKQKAGSFDSSWIDSGIRQIKGSMNSRSYPPKTVITADAMNVTMDYPKHPAFTGIDNKDIALWSDCTSFKEESSDGFPRMYPVTAGFDISKAAAENTLVLASCSHGLANAALVEYRMGEGRVILCGFDLVSHYGVDPCAEKLLCNLVNCIDEEESVPVYRYVGETICWGDFESEQGIVTGYASGLLINAAPRIPDIRKKQYKLKTDELGFRYIVGYGGWVDRPGVGYRPHGRRPFSPFSYTAGGNPQVAKENEAEGSGYFLVRLPESATRMLTTLENTSKEKISIRIDVNGAFSKTHTVPANSTITVENLLPEERNVRINFCGDRRTAILKTEFKH